MKKILLLINLLILISSCTTEEEEASTISIFDPATPGTSVSSEQKIRPIYNLNADTSTLGQVTLSWGIPATYVGIDYVVHLYKIDGDGEDFNLPDPATTYLGARLYYVSDNFEPFKGNGYVDESTVGGYTYTYLAYIECEGEFSEEARITVTASEEETYVSIPDGTNFWDSYDVTYGSSPSSGLYTYSTMSAGEKTLASPTGTFVTNDEGTLGYYVDHDRNRVVIYKSNGYGACDEFEQGSDDYYICASMYANSPLTAYGVLGQGAPDTNYSCQDSSNPIENSGCFTGPRSVLIKEGKLLVGDDNGRILYWNELPEYGCHNLENDAGIETLSDCYADRVIGKAGFDDFSVKDLSLYGDADLACPTDMDIYDGDLYIAESCRNRVVKVKDVFNEESNSCETGTFQSPLCKFQAVLGQKTLFEDKEFSDFYGTDVNYNFTTGKLSDDGFYLSRYFRAPSRIIFTNDGQLLIGANEDFSYEYGTGSLELHGRILHWPSNPLAGDTPDCREETFDLTGCESDFVAGQVGFDQILAMPIESSYHDYSYTFKNYDFDIIGSNLVMVDSIQNAVNIYTDFGNDIVGIPYSYQVANPEGATGSNNRVLPNFQNLSSVRINRFRGYAHFHDPLLNRVYRIQLY